jgi:Domain of unknown function (DUF4136)
MVKRYQWSKTMQSPQRPRLIDLIVFLISAYVLTACSSSTSIVSDYDRSVNFGSYTTYNFVEGAGPENSNYQSFFSQYMIAAITIEMDQRGYIKSANPDLLVNFNAVLQDKTKVRTSPASPPMMGGYYGYRDDFYDPWGGYGYGTETHVSQYTEGTFNIDIADARKKQLIWEAVGVGKVTEKDFENLEEVVKDGVPDFFSLYPFQAGDPNPVVTDE